MTTIPLPRPPRTRLRRKPPFAGGATAQRSYQERQGQSCSRRIRRSTGWMPTGQPAPRTERRTVCACERGDSGAERAGRSAASRAPSVVRFSTPAGGLRWYRHEHAPAARMKGWHSIELGPHFARIEGLAHGAWQARVLARDPGSDPLTSEMRVHGGPAGEHIEPFDKQTEFAEPIRLRFRRVRRRDSVEALPPSWKDVGGGKGGLPVIEVGPSEIRSAGCHRSPFHQPQRRHDSRGGGRRSRSMRS